MTNRQSTKAWHHLAAGVFTRPCSFKPTEGASHQASHCGHGFRLQERAHLTQVGEIILNVNHSRRL